MFGFAYWNPTMDPNKFGGLSKLEWPRHVRAGGQTCPLLHTRIRSGNRIRPVFLGNWFVRYFR
jgi:hypothetical protein